MEKHEIEKIVRQHEIKKSIRKNLELEKFNRRNSYLELLMVILVLLIVCLIGAVICAIDDVKLPIWNYKGLFSLIIACIFLAVFLMILSRTIKVSVSQKEIEKQAKKLLERILFFKKKGDLKTCYVLLSHQSYVRTSEALDEAISDLKEMLEQSPSIETLQVGTMKNSRREIHDRAEARKKNQ